ncbi:helix-turn-helix domain-containing protein [Flexivirga sp. ID2601S]|uniref:Helix-turn-helix domain-containing protein n=1 Tax=Flexivirga aerilata TaxID=1656889 RepID=A0A849ALK8_9MICO|nr:helix-turn-helix domain-containing protein [Flexivirga aerilata]
MAPRFASIADVAETLNISSRQAYGLVTSGALPAIKIGKAWRIEFVELEAFIQRQYEDSRSRIASGEFADTEPEPETEE